MTLSYATLCSGIEAPSVAWEPLGYRPLFGAEIDPFCCALLAHHYPAVPNLGDMEKLHDDPRFLAARPDILIAGTPCQSFSVAGLRKGLDDPRGNLALVYLRLVDLVRPRWIVWENVPGVLSIDRGSAFGEFLGALGQLGYGWAYRILDAQFFGVPQRRRRVFVVGYLGDWRRAAAVLFDSASMRRNPSPRNGPRPQDAGTLESRASTGGYDPGAHGAASGHLITAFSCKDHGADASQIAPTLRSMNHSKSHANAGGQVAVAFGGNNTQGLIDVATACNAKGGAGRSDFESETFVVEPRIARNGRGAPESVSPPLKAQSGETGKGDCAPCVVYNTLRAEGFDASEDGTGRGTPIVSQRSTVRRLTPRECERLQGFPDDYTLIPYHPKSYKLLLSVLPDEIKTAALKKLRSKPANDGPRYRALGNSMAVPVVRWLGRRIQFVDTIKGSQPDLFAGAESQGAP